MYIHFKFICKLYSRYCYGCIIIEVMPFRTLYVTQQSIQIQANFAVNVTYA